MRVIVLTLSPYLPDPWTLSADQIFDLTGGNTGNMAFQFAVIQHIGSPCKVMHLGASPEQLREAGDIIVMPLANQLGSHTDLGALADRLEAAQLPVIGIGLGAQAASQSQDISLSEGTLRWVKTMASLSPTGGPNLGVRGEYTRLQLEKLGFGDSAVVMGCPSNFIAPDENFIRKISKKYNEEIQKVAVTAGIPFVPKLDKLERDLADIVTSSGGLYIVQHAIDMIRLGRGEFDKLSDTAMEMHRKYVAPHLPTDAFKVWCRRYARAYTDIRHWMDDLSQCDFAVGTRFHGAMLAIQAGTPAGCIAHDSRVYEMCQTMGIPVVLEQDVKNITASSLKDTFVWDEEYYVSKRKALKSIYFNLLTSAGIETTRRVKL
ncbi:hypothetical protein M2360_001784 [Rhizobium sp. SG_E_25_P2]|uniref:polysaccharide pyruvyl transferase family protein n=1 Tax=Rhizobium sp. SG_E_25_P2 TaxID=2879942 RepID=UPI0024766261|nr:polysaccharide pyruvyl transferase family protein [Rhizobium sp. SG_E_25_P2]MDH6266388.1 hypothetical protein [Rhizobium sp. SG_E_25_P2]